MFRRTTCKPILAILCVLLCFACLGGEAWASEDSLHRGYLLGANDTDRRFQLQIALTQNIDEIEADVSQSIHTSKWRIDTDTVFVEYRMNYRSLLDLNTDGDAPLLPSDYTKTATCYMPITCQRGEVDRICGGVQYDYADGEYTVHWFARAVGEAPHYLEQLTDVALLSRLLSEKGAGEAHEIWLLELEIGDSENCVAAVKTSSGVYIWDLSDRSYDDASVVYEVEEFVSMLDAKNKGGINEFLGIIGGAFFISVIKVLGWLLLAAAGITLAILIVRKIIRKRRAAREK